MRQKFIAALAAATLLVAAGCTPAPIVNIPSASHSLGAAPLTVAIPAVPDGVIPSEGALLANVYAAALNAAGVKAGVANNPANPGGLVSGLKSGAFDIVPAYSRLALSELEPDAKAADPGEVLAALKAALPEGVSQLDPSKAEEQGSLVVTAVTAEKYQLKAITDLAKVCGKLAMAGTAGFKVAMHGLPELESNYNCVPKKYESLTATLNPDPGASGSTGPGTEGILWALLRDDVQVAVIHTSSPAIADNALVVLTDPQKLFPAQTIVPLAADKTVGSDVQDVVDKVSGVLTSDELSNLNRLAQDRHYGDFAGVAKAWLVQKGLIKASS